MTQTTRALELLFQAIAAVDSFEELARLRTTAWELYAGDDESFQEIMRGIEARTGALSQRLKQGDLFPAPPTDETPEYDVGSAGPAPAELVRAWCEQVRTMGPDELDAFEELTHAHWDRSSLRELRGAIENRRRQLGR